MKPLKSVKLIVIHCVANPCNMPFSVDNLIACGKAKYGQCSYYHKNKIIRRQSRYHSLSD